MNELIERLRSFVVERGKIACGSDVVSVCRNAALSLSDLRALLAEIEALRAEVRTLRRQQASWERHIAAAGCEYVRDEDGEVLVNRRAEQLDADMEPLRAEVARLNALIVRPEHSLSAEANRHYARAERLA